MRLAGGLIFILIALTSFGCQEEEIPLDRATRKVVDTLYRDEVKNLTKQLDSSCAALEDSIFPILLDSILDTRLSEREAILKHRR